MDGFKEFQGKDLDGAIAEACAYFDSPRERLEIEILQDAKTGIFGIVGARKAKVRARRAQLREAVESVLGPRSGQRGTDSGEHEEEGAAEPRGARREAHSEGTRQPRKPRTERRPPRAEGAQAAPTAASAPVPTEPETEAPAQEPVAGPAQPEEAPEPREEAPARPAPAAPKSTPHQGRRPQGHSPAPRAAAPAPGREDREPAQASPASEQAPHDLDPDDAPEGLPRTPLEDLDVERLEALTEETVKELVRPITGGRVPVSVRVEDGRVRANVDWSGEAGLLIGREGQTLAALQYLASRMVSHGMNAAVRVQLDIGDYRLRQDEKLRAIALSLAEKARATGRPYSTRPLSSYHRRIIHLALQDAQDLQTRSSGEGPLKRVVISRRRPEDA
ncbi:MAG: Jag N-terminal domain-containing protein [Desulfovibrio sp.]|nr:Jag N-terminal domain-containing protein [Desulfovibrio sp.]